MKNHQFDFKNYLTEYFGSESFLRWWETPVVLYSAKRLRENIDNLKIASSSCFREVRIYYAVKACLFSKVLLEMKERELGVEVQSLEELDTVCAAGFSTVDIICNGVGKSITYMDRALREGHLLIADSVSEWRYILGHSPISSINGRVGLRINSGNLIKSRFGAESKLGIDLSDTVIALQDASEQGLQIILHFHALSRAKSLLDINLVLTPIVTWLRSLPSNCLNAISTIDIGGGFDSPLNFSRNQLSVYDCVCRISTILGDILKNRILLMECGRYFVEDIAIGLTKVLERKSVQGKNWLIVDLGTNLLIPIPSSDFLAVEPYSQKVETTFSVADGICSPAAVISRSVELPVLSKGEHLFLLNIGAYTYTLAESFGFRVPNAIYLDSNQCYSLIDQFFSMLLWSIMTGRYLDNRSKLEKPSLLFIGCDLVLRPFQIKDTEDVAEGLANKEMSKFTERIPWPYNIDDAYKWITSMDELRRAGSLIWAIEEISLRKVIGAVEARFDSDLASVEIMYWVAKDFQCNNVGKRSVARVITFLFDSYRVSNIFGRVSPENKPSKRILESLGFIQQNELQSELLYYTLSPATRQDEKAK